MKHSPRHSKKRGGIYCGSAPRRIARKKGGLMDLAVAAKKSQEVGSLIRSKSITKQFRAQKRKK